MLIIDAWPQQKKFTPSSTEKTCAIQRKMTVKPQSAEEPASYGVKYETSDNVNHAHNPEKNK